MQTEIKNANSIQDEDTLLEGIISKFLTRLSTQILHFLRANQSQIEEIHPRHLKSHFNKSKGIITRDYKPLADCGLIEKKYDYKDGTKKDYLMLKITKLGIKVSERISKKGLTDEEWSRIKRPSPLEKPTPVELKQKTNPQPLAPPTPPFRKIKKSLLLEKIITLIKKDAKKNLIDNYESPAEILNETIEIFSNSLYEIFENFDIVKFAQPKRPQIP